MRRHCHLLSLICEKEINPQEIVNRSKYYMNRNSSACSIQIREGFSRPAAVELEFVPNELVALTLTLHPYTLPEREQIRRAINYSGHVPTASWSSVQANVTPL